MEDVERWRQQDAIKAIVEAARQWAPTRLTRTGSGTKERLESAVAAAAGIDVEDLFDGIREAGREVGQQEERDVHYG